MKRGEREKRTGKNERMHPRCRATPPAARAFGEASAAGVSMWRGEGSRTQWMGWCERAEGSEEREGNASEGKVSKP